jgi:hypothetical protein
MIRLIFKRPLSFTDNRSTIAVVSTNSSHQNS